MVAGRVVDEAAKPAAGAVIDVFVPPGQGGKATTTARSDATGVFRVSVAANRAGRVRVSDARWTLRDGDAPFSGSTADVDLGDLVALPAAAIAGQVRDARQRPVAGADVSVVSQTRQMWWPPVKSTADGNFVMLGLPPGTHMLHVMADGLLSAQTTLELTKGQRKEGVVIVVEDGMAVFGVVVDDRGKPVEGAAITSHSVSPKPPQRWASTRATSDAQGRFRCAMVPGGQGQLEVAKAGHVAVHRSDVKAGAELRLELVRLGAVHGRVVDESGTGIAGSTVARAVGRPGFLRAGHPRTQTKEDGSFELADVPAGTIHVIAEGEHASVDQPGVTVRPGEKATVELRAKRAGVLIVQVLAPDGSGVAGATVALVEPGKAGGTRNPVEGIFPMGDGRFEMKADYFEDMSYEIIDGQVVQGGRNVRRAKTDEKGVARLAAPPARYDLTARHEEFITPAPLSVKLPATGATEVTVGLQPGGFALVRTVDVAGKPLGRQTVRLRLTSGKGQRGGITDAAGKIRLGPLEPGAWQALLLTSVQRPEPWRGYGILEGGGGGRALETSLVAFRVEGGQQAEVTLTPPPLATLAGSVRSPQRPLAQAMLRWRRKTVLPDGKTDWRQTEAVRTGADGSFRLLNFEPGSYRVDIEVPGTLRRTELVEVPGPGEHRRDLLLEGRDVVVVVRAKTGDATIAGAHVSLRERSGEAEAGLPTGKEGQAKFTLLPEKEFDVSVRHEQFLPGRATVSAQAGEVTVHLLPAASLEFTEVLSASGAKQSRWEYRYRPVGTTKWIERKARVQQVVQGLEPGTIEVQARRREDRPLGEAAWGRVVRVELRAGEKAQVRLATGR
jgi:hypothetical protein